MPLRTYAKRIAQISRMGSAARQARRARNDDDRYLAQRALARAMADARGIPMKIGQLMAGAGDDDNPFRQLVPRPTDRDRRVDAGSRS